MDALTWRGRNRRQSSGRKCLIVERLEWESYVRKEQLQFVLETAKRFFGPGKADRTIEVHVFLSLNVQGAYFYKADYHLARISECDPSDEQLSRNRIIPLRKPRNFNETAFSCVRHWLAMLFAKGELAGGVCLRHRETNIRNSHLPKIL